MRRSTANWLAWSTWVFTGAFVALSLVFMFVNAPAEFWLNVFNMLVLLTCATVGALIASHRPNNPIGWIFCAGACLWAFGVLALEYAVYTLVVRPGALPAGLWMAWVGIWARGFGALPMMTFLLLLFPTGRLPTRGWRPVGWLAIANLVCFTIVAAVSPPSYDERLPHVRNAIGIALDAASSDWLLLGSFVLFLASMIASAAAVVARFRRAQRDERQQIKWLVYAAALGITLLILMFVLAVVSQSALPSFAWFLSLAGIPIAVGVAILRHRLYDIDILINRTLVYSALTVSLALVYIGCVVLLRQLLAPLTGNSEVAIVASTLVIAALFNPLRRRIQAIIDKRFYRRKYDAAQVLAAFSVRMRDETNLDALTSEMLRVVDETMQPAHVSLWLREPGSDKVTG